MRFIATAIASWASGLRAPRLIAPETKWWRIDSTGSTDYGDLANLMPTIQFGTGGFKGVLHNPDVMPTDEYLAYVMTAKVFALAGYKLLKNGGTYAKAMIDSYKALMTKEEYIAYMDSMMSSEKIEMNPLPLLDEQK